MRIRSIKPEFWRSDDIAALDWDDRLLFIGLWSYVDDNGVGRDEERIIAADLFALDASFSESSLRVHDGLMRLHAANLIERYEVNGRHFLHITTWEKHQKINRPSPGRYPLPIVAGATETVEKPTKPRTFSESSQQLHESSVSPHNILSAGTGEQGNRGTGEQIPPIAPQGAESDDPHDDDSEYSDAFRGFWEQYPKHYGMGDALRAYRRAQRKVNRTILLSAAQRYAADPNRVERFTLSPAKWLDGEHWNDGPLPDRGGDSTRYLTKSQKAQAEWDEDRRIRAEIQAEERQAKGDDRLALTD